MDQEVSYSSKIYAIKSVIIIYDSWKESKNVLF